MAIKLDVNRTLLIILLLLVVVAMVVTAVMIAEFSNGELIARAAEGAGGVFGTIDDNISPWAIDAERSITWARLSI